jgi:hypothetical protein
LTLINSPTDTSIRQHASAYVSIRQHAHELPGRFEIDELACRYQHTSDSIRQHTSACELPGKLALDELADRYQRQYLYSCVSTRTFVLVKQVKQYVRTLQCKLAYRYEGSTREGHPVMALVQHLPLAVNHLYALLHHYLYFCTSKASKIEHLPMTVNHREEAQ